MKNFIQLCINEEHRNSILDGENHKNIATTGPHHLLIINDFFNLKVAQKLAQGLSTTDMKKIYQVKKSIQGCQTPIQQPSSEQKFNQLPSEQKFYRYNTSDNFSSGNFDLQYQKNAFSLFANIMASQCMISFLKNFYCNGISEIGQFRAYEYRKDDFLNMHSDDNGTRKVAWIYNLTQNWEKSDGGLLTFHSFKDNLLTQYIPVFNQLILFEVSKLSFHSVSKVTSLNKFRLSIGGWYK